MNKPCQHLPRVIVIGASAGGISALQIVLARLPDAFPLAILIAQHRPANMHSNLTEILARASALPVKEAQEAEEIRGGTVYLAPANYHLLVETNATLSLSVDAHVCFARPSIDILFESAAQAFHENLIAIILSGANADGSAGIKKVAQCGGITIVQEPSDAEMPDMPRAALLAVEANYVLPLADLAAQLCKLSAVPERTCHHANGS